MEAGTRLCHATVVVLLAISSATSSDAANFRTQNFIVQAPTPQLANAVGVAAEKYRHDLAMHWLGTELRSWPTPCPIRVIAGPTLAAQGVTTYNRAPVRDFQMEVVGTPERILDSVLPHEVTHTILATHFGRPLPRWADEGICTTVEHAAERNKHEAKLREFLQSRRGIAMNQLFLLTEYPNDVLPMYAQGYSVCRFLIDQQGPRTFIQFLSDYMQSSSWTANVKKHYGYDSLAELQQYWLAWVSEGSGPVEKFAKSTPSTNSAIATNPTRATSPASGAVAVASLNAPRSNSTPKATALASIGDTNTTGQGWYLRRRNDPNHPEPSSLALASQSIASPAPASNPETHPRDTFAEATSNTVAEATSGAIRRIAPPSILQSGSYSAAQPQSEQQISRANLPPSGIPLSKSTRDWNARSWR